MDLQFIKICYLFIKKIRTSPRKKITKMKKKNLKNIFIQTIFKKIVDILIPFIFIDYKSHIILVIL